MGTSQAGAVRLNDLFRRILVGGSGVLGAVTIMVRAVISSFFAETFLRKLFE
jgi:hypothetical protein